MVILPTCQLRCRTELGRDMMAEPSNVKPTYLTQQLREAEGQVKELDEIQALSSLRIFIHCENGSKRLQPTSLPKPPP